MRVTLARLWLVPLLVVALVVSVPYAFGDHPVTWQQAERLALRQIVRLPGEPLADQLAELEPVDEGRWAAPRPLPMPGSGSGLGSHRQAPVERYPVQAVRSRWTPGTPQMGVQVYWESDQKDPEQVVWEKSQRIVNYVTALNANAITITFPFFTPGMKATTVGPGAVTPSPHRVEILVHEAALAGLQVTLRPLLDEKSLNPPDGWRGSIRPDSKDAWFDSYQAFLTPYLGVAERQHVATFVIGTELNSLEPLPHWRTLVSTAHQTFTGIVRYDLNYDNYLRGVYPAGPDGYGIDAYLKVTAPDSAPPSAVTAGWNATLAKTDPRAPSGVLLSEVGIGARRGAFSAPGDFTSAGTFDAQIQPTWYEGVCEVARQHQFAGIYFWKVDFDADPAHPTTAGRANLDFIGHPASEQAIRACLSAPWQVPLAPGTAPATPVPQATRGH